MTESEWQDISTAPLNGGLVRLKLESGYELNAFWLDGLVGSSGEDVGVWSADDGYPDSWTDGFCWLVNERGVPGDQPTHWAPVTPPQQGE